MNAETVSTSRMRPWAICGVLLLATMLNYMDRQALAVTLPLFKADFALAEDRIGIVEGCFGFAFASGSLLFGWLADKTGPRFLYPLVLIGWSLSGIATSLAGTPWVTDLLEANGDPPGTGTFRWLIICRVLLGICEAGHWPCALLTVRSLLTDRHRTLGNGILQSGASIGAIVVLFYIEFAEWAGSAWHFPFWSIGLVGLLWVPAWFLAIGSVNPRGTKSNGVSADARDAAAETSGFLSRVIVLAIVVATLTISWQFLRAWLVLYLQDHLHYTAWQSRLLTCAYYVAADVGCMFSGFLVVMLTRSGLTVHRARLSGFFLFCLLTACGALVPLVHNPGLMIALLLTAGAGILGLHPYYYSMVQELPRARMGFLSGLLAAGGWVVSSISQILLGRQIEATHSYRTGLVIVGLAPTVGLLAILLLWPKTPRDVPN